MKRTIIAAVLTAVLGTGANAAADLIQVPATCGTVKDVHELLNIKMPHPEPIAKGGNSRGEDVAVLLAGDGYWALVAKLSQDRVCVVASGYNWTTATPGEVNAF
jgi:hypothetical protein